MFQKNWPCPLQFHHTGCITRSIEESTAVYRDVLGFTNISQVYNITAQKVKVCFIETAPGVYLELVEATEENNFFEKILKSKNPFYHIGLFAKNFDESVQAFSDNGFYLLNTFSSEAFNGLRCAFFYSSEMHLVELIETP